MITVTDQMRRLTLVVLAVLCTNTPSYANYCKRNYDQCVQYGGNTGGCMDQFNECHRAIDGQVREEMADWQRQVQQIERQHESCLDAAKKGFEDCGNAIGGPRTAATCVAGYTTKVSICMNNWSTALEGGRKKKPGQHPSIESECCPATANLLLLPPPPVPAANREQYVALGRMATNLNQLTRLANAGQLVVVPERLLQRLAAEVRRLRLALLGAEDTP